MESDEILVSFDVSSLFTNVPVDEAISVICERLREDETLGDSALVRRVLKKFREVIIAIVSMSLVNHQFAVLNPGRLVGSWCVCYARVADLCLFLCSTASLKFEFCCG